MTIASADPYALLAPFYDLEVGDFDADLDLYRGFAARCDGPILELGVGTGRVATALAAEGHDVTGLDNSPAMLALARKRCEAAGVAIELREGDMRSFDLGRRYDLVICALGSFRHLFSADDHLSALRSVARHLAPAGQFVIDLPSWHSVDWDQRPSPVLFDWIRTDPATGATVTKFNILQSDPARQVQHLTAIYDVQDADRVVHRFSAEVPLYTFTQPELEMLLKSAGLQPTHWYGSFDLEPYEATSHEMIAVTRAARPSDGRAGE